MKLYTSPTCGFMVPDAWLPESPAGYAEPLPPEDGRASVQVVERFLDAPRTAAEAAAALRTELPHLTGEATAHTEQAVSTGDGRSALRLGFTYRNEDEDLVRESRVLLTCGPYLCELVLTRPESSDGSLNAARDRIFDGVVSSLAFTRVDAFSGAHPLAVDRALAAVELLDEAAPRWAFPGLCASLPELPGWTLADDGGNAEYRRPGAEISVARVLGEATDAGSWLASTLRRHAARGGVITGSQRFEDQQGNAWAAVACDERAQERRWSSAASRRTLQILSPEPQPLEWTLRAHGTVLAGLENELARLVRNARWLPPAQWETRVAEPWLDLVLRGPWRPEGQGLYVNSSEPFTILHVFPQPTGTPLAAVKDKLLAGARQAFSSIGRVDVADGVYAGAPALSLRAEGLSQAGGPLATSVTWVQARNGLLTHVLMADQDAKLSPILADLLAGLRLP